MPGNISHHDQLLVLEQELQWSKIYTKWNELSLGGGGSDLEGLAFPTAFHISLYVAAAGFCFKQVNAPFQEIFSWDLFVEHQLLYTLFSTQSSLKKNITTGCAKMFI